jgi:hypothetical protein
LTRRRPLAISRILFIAVGVLWLLIGLATPWASERSAGRGGMFLTHDTDLALYGAEPQKLLATRPDLLTLRRTVFRVIAGLFVAAGILVIGVAWFGLRSRSPWALGLLTVVGLAVLPYWWIALAPYRAAGIKLPLSVVPPFMWVPGLLAPLASLIGWIDIVRKGTQ